MWSINFTNQWLLINYNWLISYLKKFDSYDTRCNTCNFKSLKFLFCKFEKKLSWYNDDIIIIKCILCITYNRNKMPMPFLADFEKFLNLKFQEAQPDELQASPFLWNPLTRCYRSWCRAAIFWWSNTSPFSMMFVILGLICATRSKYHCQIFFFPNVHFDISI